MAALSGPELEPLAGPDLLPGEDEALKESVMTSGPGYPPRTTKPPVSQPEGVMTPVKQPRPSKAPRLISTHLTKTGPNVPTPDRDVKRMPEVGRVVV